MLPTQRLGTKATVQAQTSIGKYNAIDADALFIVGNGTQPRSNALPLNDGSATVQTQGIEDNSVVIKETLDDDLANKLDITAAVGEKDSDGGEIFNDYLNNVATGTNSHAEGSGTTASGYHSHAEGLNTTAAGAGSHTEGYLTATTSAAAYSHAGGYGTIASAEAQTAIGKYNAEDTNALFIVGNGTSSSRSNAFTVKLDGSATVQTQGTSNNSVIIKSTLDTALAGKQSTSITDAGGYFTADTVEGALQEIGAQLSGLDEALEALL